MRHQGIKHASPLLTVTAVCVAILTAMATPPVVTPAVAQTLTQDDAAEVLSLYRAFATAQNARDLTAVRRTLLSSPSFLWVSDGAPVWGTDAVIERMGSFQKAEIWRVEPDLAKSVVVPLAQGSAMLHLPLTLVIGSQTPGPDRLRFLVEVISVKSAAGWRIAALLTTTDKAAE